MPAHIVERVDRVRRAARDDDAFARDMAQKVIARIRNRLRAPGADPACPVEALHLLPENIAARIVARGQRVDAQLILRRMDFLTNLLRPVRHSSNTCLSSIVRSAIISTCSGVTRSSLSRSGRQSRNTAKSLCVLMLRPFR